jgi:hypothetical protein
VSLFLAGQADAKTKEWHVFDKRGSPSTNYDVSIACGQLPEITVEHDESAALANT